MKISILGDLHFGAHGDNESYLQYQLECLDNYISTLQESNIKMIFQVGDFFNSRKSVNMKTYHIVKERFLKKLEKLDIFLYVLSGNHDLYYTTSSEITTLSVIEEFKNVMVVKKPEMVTISGFNIGMIPWLSNEKDIENFKTFVNNNNPHIIMGHFEFAGFEVVKGYVKSSGIDSSIVSNFKDVYSGHYHTKQVQGNITYVGTPYEKDWGDYNIDKFWHEYDIDKRRLIPVKNDNKLHYVINYDENPDIDKDKYTDKKVKIIANDSTTDEFQKWLNEFEDSVDMEKFSVVDLGNVDDSEVEEIEVVNKGILEVIQEYMVNSGKGDKKDLMKIYEMLYNKVGEVV